MAVRIFLSAVSDEFRDYRALLRSDLTRHNVEVKVQEDFKEYGHSTLEKLDLYIDECDAVIHLVGDLPGWEVPAAALKSLLARYPDIVEKLPPLKPVFAEGRGLSYTQAEAWLALYHDKTLLIARAGSGAPRGPRYKPTDASRAAQAAHLAMLAKVERFGVPFANPDELAKQIAVALIDILAREHSATLAKEQGVVRRRQPNNLPYASLGPLFKGRDRFMEMLHDSLWRRRNGGATAVVGKALHGLGGVGKTRLSVEYAYKYAADYSALLFVSADSPQLLDAGLAKLAEPDILDLSAEELAKGGVPAVLRWLENNPLWLLIFDNVDDESAAAAVENLLPRLRGGHALITGRLPDYSAAIDTLPLDVLPPEDAAEFLLERTKGRRAVARDDAPLAAVLAAELDGLALGLEQAGAYICKNRIGLASYLALWRKNREAVLKWVDRRLMGYNKDVGMATTWKTSFAMLTPGGRRLLDRLAFLAPEPIPEALLGGALPTDDDLIDGTIALADLDGYSLVMRDSNRETSRFWVHRLVLDATRRNMTIDDACARLGESVKWIRAAFDDEELAPFRAQLIPHVVCVLHFLHLDDYQAAAAGDSLDALAQEAIYALLDAGAENISPEYLASVLSDFYEVEPLWGAIKAFRTENRAAWPALQKQLLGVNNYVLRYAIAATLADAYEGEPEVLDEIVALVERAGEHNEFEAGGYALAMVYMSHPDLIAQRLLDRLAADATYVGPSIVSFLLLNLAYRKEQRPVDLRALVASPRVWQPLWDFTKLDVWEIEAAEAFMAEPRREPAPDASPEVKDCYAWSVKVQADIDRILAGAEIGAAVRKLLERYHSLGEDEQPIRAAKDELAACARLPELMRILFAHPIWSVAEAAASVLSALSKTDPRCLDIIDKLLGDENWRVQYGANEAAFAVGTRHEAVFHNAVRRLYDHANPRIRGLCAENLISVMLNSGHDKRKCLFEAFKPQLCHWLRDEDCWVLEHVFRLFNSLHLRRIDATDLLAAPASRLFDDRADWYKLSRADFLRHIERRKRELMAAPAHVR
ncbi:MAG TPA: DUF4062 domain-containing protein [Xanthobacteraceae bacterium]|nr:DUF4062 domain-containing protein [Xanthobacteraceae bacterium]